MKHPLVILFLLSAICQCTYGQSRKLTDRELNESTGHKLLFADTSTCGELNKWVKSDIDNKTIFLFLRGGIAPIYISTDSIFENKFNIYYYDFGDTGPPDDKCIIMYNKQVFEYLTHNYGSIWLRTIRKDILGLSEWEKDQKNPGAKTGTLNFYF